MFSNCSGLQVLLGRAGTAVTGSSAGSDRILYNAGHQWNTPGTARSLAQRLEDAARCHATGAAARCHILGNPLGRTADILTFDYVTVTNDHKEKAVSGTQLEDSIEGKTGHQPIQIPAKSAVFHTISS